MAVAHLGEELHLIGALVNEVVTPFERLGSNIYNLGAIASIAVTGSLDEKKQAYADLKAESEKFYKDLDSRLSKFRGPNPLYADRLQKQFDSSDATANQRALYENVTKIKQNDSLAGFTARPPTVKAVKVKVEAETVSAFDGYVKELDRMIVKQDESEFSSMRMKLSQIALKERIGESTQRFTDAADKIGQYQASLEKAKLSDHVTEYRRLIHPYPVRHFTVSFTTDNDDLWTRVLGLYHRAYGMFAGVRVRCLDDYSTNANVGTPTAFDSAMTLLSGTIYPLQKKYGVGGTPLAIGLPVRSIFKPVSGTVKVAIGTVELPTGGFSLSSSGVVTLPNKTANITGISYFSGKTYITAPGHSNDVRLRLHGLFVGGEPVAWTGRHGRRCWPGRDRLRRGNQRDLRRRTWLPVRHDMEFSR